MDLDHYYSCLSQDEKVRHMQALAKHMASPVSYNVSTPMFLSSSPSPSTDAAAPWHPANPIKEVVKQPGPVVVIPAPVAKPPAQKAVNYGPFRDTDENVYYKVCSSNKCPCKVYPKSVNEDENGNPLPPKRPSVNPKGLYVYGFDQDDDFEKSRADIKHILGRKARYV